MILKYLLLQNCQAPTSALFITRILITHTCYSSSSLIRTATNAHTSSHLVWGLICMKWSTYLTFWTSQIFPSFMSTVFSVYNFFCPGTKNVKADACLHAPKEVTKEPEPILLPNWILSPIQWSPQLTTSSNASETAPDHSTPHSSPSSQQHSRCLKIASGGAIWPGVLWLCHLKEPGMQTHHGWKKWQRTPHPPKKIFYELRFHQTS